MAEADKKPWSQHRARAKEAWTKRDRWNKVLADVYDFVAPHRRSTRLQEGGEGDRASRIFDPHATNVLHRVVGRILEDVFPSGEQFVMLEPGPAVKEDDLDKARAETEDISTKIAPNFWRGDFDNAIAATITDGLISSGYTLILKGDRARPVRFVNIPHDEMANDRGPYDEKHGFFWKRKWKRRAIKEAFPDGKFDADFKLQLETKGEEEVMLCQDLVFDAKKKRWRLCVYLDGKDCEDIHSENFKTCRIFCFEYFRLPGEDYGFGPILMNLPLIKTLNKTVELALKGAALNALGIYTRINDGVFNPDTARLEPGAFWTVARNGGPTGPSIARLPNSTDPNLNMITIQDMRNSISVGMNDEEMPSPNKSPRAAAEIIERSRRQRKNHAGAFSRIIHDIFIAMLPAIMEIMEEMQIIDKAVEIDQLLVRIKLVSPLGAAFRARKAETYVEWATVAASLAPQSLGMMTPLEASLVQVGRDMGVPEAQLNSVSEQDMLAQRVREGVAQALEAMQAQAGGPPAAANGDPAQAA
ncbi:portal protein [Methylocystis sp.]|uniref:portal protein n=1 Tax=Methylocystis sp. TaxID=1911079 RepID=UPI0027340836|nr:portal protein [Methylocystis sp.]MDP3554834.1 portal protein [Methylocystis sp.]